MLDEALALLERGFSIIPIRHLDKKPLLKSWKKYEEKAPSAEEVRKWVNNWPNMNVAVVTGAVSGVVVMDVDDPEVAYGELRDREVPEGPLSQTAKGFHHWFRHPGQGVRIKNGVKVLQGIDVRGDGGYVLVPPSFVDPDRPYLWQVCFEEAELPPMPEWLVQMTVDSARPQGTDIPQITGTGPGDRTFSDSDEWYIQTLVKGAEEGNRNNALTQLVGRWYHRRLAKEEIRRLAQMVNVQHFDPPLDEAEVNSIVESIGREETRNRLLQMAGGSPIRYDEDPMVVNAMRGDVLESISNAIGVPIVRFLKYRGESGDIKYVLKTQKGDVAFPDSSGVIFFKKAQIYLADAAGIIVDERIAKNWNVIRTQLMYCCELIEVAATSSRADMMGSYLRYYLNEEAGLPESEEDWESVAMARAPFLFNGAAHIFLEDLYKILRYAKDVTWSREQMATILRESGCIQKEYHVVQDGRRYTRTAWRIPPKLIEQPAAVDEALEDEKEAEE